MGFVRFMAVIAVLGAIGWGIEKIDPPNKEGDTCPMFMDVGETKVIDGKTFECVEVGE